MIDRYLHLLLTLMCRHNSILKGDHLNYMFEIVLCFHFSYWPVSKYFLLGSWYYWSGSFRPCSTVWSWPSPGCRLKNKVRDCLIWFYMNKLGITVENFWNNSFIVVTLLYIWITDKVVISLYFFFKRGAKWVISAAAFL